MQLVGRAGEIAEIGALLDEVRAGETRILVVRGEAGIGKTRLIRLLMQEAGRRRLEVIAGRATEHESDVPLAIFVDAFGPELRRLDENDVAPDLWQLVGSVTEHLDLRTERHPVAVVLDDVHWADPTSLGLLDALVRRPPSATHFLVAAVRPGRVADALLAAARATGRSVTVLDLAPLSRAGVEELLGPERSAAEADALYASSGGNPLLLEELAKGDSATGVPIGVVAVVSAELDHLDVAARALAEAGAVLGDPFDIDLAGETAALDRRAALEALDSLIAHGLVVPTSKLREFGFRHPVIRTAVHDGLSYAARADSHAMAAGVLAANGAGLPEQARHLAQIAGPGDLVHAKTLRGAAAIIRPQAPSIAADWLSAARRASPGTDLVLVCELAEVLLQSGRVGEALDVAQDGLTNGHGDDDSRLRLTLVAGAVERTLGRHDSARRRLVRARNDGASGPRCVELLAALALSSYQLGDYVEMGRWAGLARDAPTENRVARAAASAMLAMMRRFAGDVDGADSESDAAFADIRNATDDELAANAELAAAVPWALAALEHLPEALTASRRAAAAARLAGNGTAHVTASLPQIVTLAVLGRVEEAEEVADRTELAARLTHNDQTIQWALWMRAWVLLERGKVDAAVIAAKESVEIAADLDDSALITVANAVLGSAFLDAGDVAKALPLLAAYDVEPTWICRWAPRLVSAHITQGDVRGASAAAERASTIASASGLTGAVAAAHRAEALAASGRDDQTTAAQHARSAIELAQSMGADLDIAQAHILAGRALGSSDRDEALRHLGEAQRLAARGGAVRTEREAIHDLRRLGRRIGRGGARAAGESGLSTLSTRQREIADLVAAGYTNREIAARIFLSEKTVESHLSQVFAKLGVASRAAVAARVSARPD
jgi:DNA-binding NarL/FixJ family response regulator